MQDKKNGTASRVLWYLTISLMCCLSTTVVMVCKWAKGTFNVGLNAIVNTLFSPLKGTSSDTIIPAIKYCLPVVLLAAVVCFFYVLWDRKHGKPLIRYAVTLVSVMSIIVAFIYVQISYDIVGYIVAKMQETDIYEDYYIDPREVAIKAPEEKRNLIYIYLESMETTYTSETEGGIQKVNYMPNLTRLAKENISFSNYNEEEKLGGLRPVTGATWTMAALYASTSGVPFAFPIGSNDMESQTVFASGIYTLGDFLNDQGYTQEFLCGSDATFGGRRNYFEQHGYYEILDLYEAREKGYIPEDYCVWWGFEDFVLYDIAKEELLHLAEEEQPFNFTMMTVDAHHIGGYKCRVCEDEYKDTTANVISCGDRQLMEFIDWCKGQDFYEKTTIVIVGDHPRMDTCLVDGVAYNERTLYNCFINSVCTLEGKDKGREATAMDLFPTVLASMGYEIEDEQLGLGVNLFSDEETFTEKKGLETLNNEFAKTSTYYVERFSPEFGYLVEDQKTSICTIYMNNEDYNATEYIPQGICESIGRYAWSSGTQMVVKIPLETKVDKVRITIHLYATNGAQSYVVLQNGEEIATGQQEGYGSLCFDATVIDGECNFEVMLPGAISREEVGDGDDPTKIALAISSITVNEIN